MITAHESLAYIPFVTRIPSTIHQEKQLIETALLSADAWFKIDKSNRCQSYDVVHYDLKQRWVVIYSLDARDCSEHRIKSKVESELEKVEKALQRFSSEKFFCEKDAFKALDTLNKKLLYHNVLCKAIRSVKSYKTKGRPTSDAACERRYQLECTVHKDTDKIKASIERGSCFVIGTSVSKDELTDAQVLEAYKKQNSTVERGFRFLKDPIMFTSSLFLKKPSRISGLLRVMTLALLVYTIAQRKLRQTLEQLQATIPNQINKEIKKPTLRWVFQMLNGIDAVTMRIVSAVNTVVTGLNDLRRRILYYFGTTVLKIYLLDPNSALNKIDTT